VTLAITYDLGSFVAENWSMLLQGLYRTLIVSAIAIADTISVR